MPSWMSKTCTVIGGVSLVSVVVLGVLALILGIYMLFAWGILFAVSCFTPVDITLLRVFALGLLLTVGAIIFHGAFLASKRE